LAEYYFWRRNQIFGGKFKFLAENSKFWREIQIFGGNLFLAGILSFGGKFKFLCKVIFGGELNF
jgi:hypothetical protein